MSVPGIGRPIESSRALPGGLIVNSGDVSVKPYPMATCQPSASRSSPNSGSSRAPPEATTRTVGPSC